MRLGISATLLELALGIAPAFVWTTPQVLAIASAWTALREPGPALPRATVPRIRLPGLLLLLASRPGLFGNDAGASAGASARENA